MDEQARMALQEQLDALEAAQRALDEVMRPFLEAQSRIINARELLIEQHGAEIAGRCETCNRVLFTGEQGHQCEDGPLLCAEHAPTWGDFKRMIAEGAKHLEQDQVDAIAKTIAEREAAGGSLDDKVLYTL